MCCFGTSWLRLHPRVFIFCVDPKVREATSNDPWGPSSSLMSEIADLTYNVVAFSEIMSMVWKRLNDHGKNWRHVYKVGRRYSCSTLTRQSLFFFRLKRNLSFCCKQGTDTRFANSSLFKTTASAVEPFSFWFLLYSIANSKSFVKNFVSFVYDIMVITLSPWQEHNLWT